MRGGMVRRRCRKGGNIGGRKNERIVGEKKEI